MWAGQTQECAQHLCMDGHNPCDGPTAPTSVIFLLCWVVVSRLWSAQQVVSWDHHKGVLNNSLIPVPTWLNECHTSQPWDPKPTHSHSFPLIPTHFHSFLWPPSTDPSPLHHPGGPSHSFHPLIPAPNLSTRAQLGPNERLIPVPKWLNTCQASQPWNPKH